MPVGGRQPQDPVIWSSDCDLTFPRKNNYHFTFPGSDSAGWGPENIYEELFFLKLAITKTNYKFLVNLYKGTIEMTGRGCFLLLRSDRSHVEGSREFQSSDR